MINLKEFLIYILTTAVLSMIYMSCCDYAEKGYGYTGYRGFHHHHSWWYCRNYDENLSASNRENSQSGNKFSQRGLSGGK